MCRTQYWPLLLIFWFVDFSIWFLWFCWRGSWLVLDSVNFWFECMKVWYKNWIDGLGRFALVIQIRSHLVHLIQFLTRQFNDGLGRSICRDRPWILCSEVTQMKYTISSSVHAWSLMDNKFGFQKKKINKVESITEIQLSKTSFSIILPNFPKHFFNNFFVIENFC